MALDGLTQKIVNNYMPVINMVKTLTTTPALINTDISQGAKYAIPLMVETNQMSAQAEVSESLLITQESKKYISDNVAPGSKTWNLSGYIDGIKAAEPTNYYKPIMRLFTDILWQWFNRGAVLKFLDGNARIYQKVVIKSLQTSQQKDAADAVAFQMTLKEINVMEINGIEETVGALGLTATKPKLGSIIGEPMNMGTVTSESLLDFSI
jgi:hypothetical protein